MRTLLAFGLCCGLGGCGSTPQVLDEEETYATVDALWTAVTAKRPDLLEQTAGRLKVLAEEGKLSAEGLTALERIIARARQGDWTPAAKELKTFIQRQRKTKPAPNG